MTLIVNGKIMELEEDTTLARLIARLDWDRQTGAVAVNLTFVPAGTYETVQLQEGDTVEILAPVYGG